MPPILTYLFVIVFVNQFSVSLAVDLPVVQIVAWMESDDYRWKSGNEMELQGITHNQTTFIVPGDIHGLVITCNASYPVEWEFQPDEHLDPNVMVYSIRSNARREGDGIQTPFTFSMKLNLYGDTNAFTGKYVCRKVNSDADSYFGDIQTQIYVFWEGNSPPYIMGAGKTVKVSSYLQGSVRLPCPVAFPEVDVFLQRKTNVTNKDNTTELKFVDLEFSTNNSALAPIIYDPSTGFILDNTIDRNKSIDGEYKCLTAEKDDVLTVVVTPDKIAPTEKHSGKDKLESGAKISYNETSQQFTCCSNTDKPPSIYTFWCTSYVHCKLATPLIYHNMIEKLKNFQYGRSTTANCVSTYVYQGAYRCIGNGVDLTRVVFSGYYMTNGTYKREIFWSWQDITKEKQQKLVSMYLQVMRQPGSSMSYSPWLYYQPGIGPNPTFYTGQNVSFSCQPSTFYFAEGLAWKIGYKNQTTSIQTVAADSIERRYWYWTPPSQVYMIISTQIQSVSCMAPIWNTTEWVEKEYLLKTRDPTPPTVSSPDADDLYWTLNDTDVSITCVANGDPSPRIRWFMNGKEFLGDTGNVKLLRGNGTLTIKFLVAEYAVHGSYLCTAENIASRAEKMFNVFVEEGHPWLATTIITCICLVFLTILGVLGWRLKVSHDTASELRWRTS